MTIADGSNATLYALSKHNKVKYWSTDRATNNLRNNESFVWLGGGDKNQLEEYGDMAAMVNSLVDQPTTIWMVQKKGDSLLSRQFDQVNSSVRDWKIAEPVEVKLLD